LTDLVQIITFELIFFRSNWLKLLITKSLMNESLTSQNIESNA